MEELAWQQWLSRYEAELKSVGLPPAVTTNEAHWLDFLQNGYLELHPEAYDGFSFDQLLPEQMQDLLAVLEASPQYVGELMTGWLRHRLGRQDE